MLEKILNLMNVILSSRSFSKSQPVSVASPAKVNVAISIEAYFADPKTGEDRRIKYPKEYTTECLANATELLKRVNALLMDHGILSCVVSSGWRPSAVNGAVGGAKKSGHLIGKAIDLKDGAGELDRTLASKPELLRKHGLFLESPDKTTGWTHLDFIDRPDRPNRIFIP